MSTNVRQPWEPDPLLTVAEVARWLSKPKATLYAWRSRGLGPRAIRVGNVLLWFTFTHHLDATFASFWSSRGLDGFDRSDTGALRALFQNTLDYGLREVLRDNQPVIYRVGSGFRIDKLAAPLSWSAIAVVPPDDTSYSVRMYGDREQTPAGFLTASQHAQPQTEFIAFDNSAARGRHLLPAGAPVHRQRQPVLRRIPAGAGAGVAAWDVPRVDGEPPHGLRTDAQHHRRRPGHGAVTPTFATLDLGLFVMAPGQRIQTRGQRVASSSTGVLGATQTVTFTPTVTGLYGILVTNNHEGFGDFTFTVS